MILGISTSLSQFTVALEQEGQMLHYKQQVRIGPTPIDLNQMVIDLFAESKTSIGDVKKLVVDIGPGGTSAVRTGVAFANGLAYSRNIPIAGISSAEIMGVEGFQMSKKPTGILFKSIKQHYFCGLHDGKTISFKYDKLDRLADQLKSFTKLTLAGNNDAISNLAEHLADVDLTITSIHKVNAEVFGNNLNEFAKQAVYYPELPTPINEQNLNSL